MSHFTVLVIGEDPEVQLAPFHEFECTGTNDEYVQDIDILKQTQEEYQTSVRLMLRDEGGSLHDAYDDRFIDKGGVEGTGVFSRGKRIVPDGYTEVHVPTPELMSFAEWLSEERGIKILTGDRPP